MTEMHQLLCGKINLWDEVDGRTVLRPHPLQVAEGVCAHEQAHPVWQAAMDGAARRGWRYLGLQGDVEWPVHVWLAGESIHSVTVPPAPAKVAWEKGAKPVKGAKYTREVWAPSGAPVPPVTYDRTWPEAEALPELRPPESVCPLFVYGSGEPGCGHDEPGPVRDLIGAALLAGWTVARGHSRGGVMGGTGRQLAVADIWSVRFRRPGWMGYAVRRGNTWDSVCVAGASLPPFLALGVTDLREWLADPEQGAGWYEGIRLRVAAQKLAAKKVKCPGAPSCTEERHHEHRGDGAIKFPKPRSKIESGG